MNNAHKTTDTRILLQSRIIEKLANNGLPAEKIRALVIGALAPRDPNIALIKAAQPMVEEKLGGKGVTRDELGMVNEIVKQVEEEIRAETGANAEMGAALTGYVLEGKGTPRGVEILGVTPDEKIRVKFTDGKERECNPDEVYLGNFEYGLKSVRKSVKTKMGELPNVPNLAKSEIQPPKKADVKKVRNEQPPAEKKDSSAEKEKNPLEKGKNEYGKKKQEPSSSKGREKMQERLKVAQKKTKEYSPIKAICSSLAIALAAVVAISLGILYFVSRVNPQEDGQVKIIRGAQKSASSKLSGIEKTVDDYFKAKKNESNARAKMAEAKKLAAEKEATRLARIEAKKKAQEEKQAEARKEAETKKAAAPKPAPKPEAKPAATAKPEVAPKPGPEAVSEAQINNAAKRMEKQINGAKTSDELKARYASWKRGAQKHPESDVTKALARVDKKVREKIAELEKTEKAEKTAEAEKKAEKAAEAKKAAEEAKKKAEKPKPEVAPKPAPEEAQKPEAAPKPPAQEETHGDVMYYSNGSEVIAFKVTGKDGDNFVGRKGADGKGKKVEIRIEDAHFTSEGAKNSKQ